MRELRAIDLCGGAGGWACAARGLPIQILAAVDVWPLACETYRLNHPGTDVIEADLRQPETQAKVRAIAERVGGLDLVLGGIPCQWLSPARKRNTLGEEEIAAGLDLLRSCLNLVRDLKPRYWCLEDVVQLRRYLPPLTPYRVLDARALGYSPQARRRLFVGEFPAPEASGYPLRQFCVMADAGPHFLTQHGRTCELAGFSRRRNLSPSGLRVGLPLSATRVPTVLNWGNRHHNVAVLVLDKRSAGGRRELTLAEAARLQGFPPDFTFVGAASAAWRMVANAIQIDLGRAILWAVVKARLDPKAGAPA